MIWDSTKRILKSYGNYDNVSAYVRIEMDSSVEQSAIDPRLLPFGVYGPTKYIGTTGMTETTIGSTSTIIMSGSKAPFGPANVLDTGSLPSVTLSLSFPDSATRATASAGGISDPKNAYFGLNVSSYMELLSNGS